MNAKIPKTLAQLTPAEQRKIEQICQDNINHEEAELQKILLKLMCAVLHRTFGFGESRCLRVLGGFKRMYAKNGRLASKEEQAAWLAEELKFMRGGWPQEYIDSMEK